MTVTNWDEPLSPRAIFYCRERLRNRIFDCVIKALADRVAMGTVPRAKLAKRLGKDPAQISRWFSGPSNWTIDTISDLMLALNAELILEHKLYEHVPVPNYRHPLAETTDSWSKSYVTIRADGGSDLNATGSGRAKAIVRVAS